MIEAVLKTIITDNIQRKAAIIRIKSLFKAENMSKIINILKFLDNKNYDLYVFEVLSQEFLNCYLLKIILEMNQFIKKPFGLLTEVKVYEILGMIDNLKSVVMDTDIGNLIKKIEDNKIE